MREKIENIMRSIGLKLLIQQHAYTAVNKLDQIIKNSIMVGIKVEENYLSDHYTIKIDILP